MMPTFGIPVTANKNPQFVRMQITFRRKVYRPARLVCEAFHGPPPPGKPNALHRDENPRNNRPENLFWGSQRENYSHPKISAYVRSGHRGRRVYPL